MKLASVLRKQRLSDVKALARARVPIVKFRDPALNFACDICINNVLAIKNTQLLSDYCRLDDRFRQLTLVVKHWAKQREINETYKGTLGSYTYALLVLNFLQRRSPPVLPCLQLIPPVGHDNGPLPVVDVCGYNCYYFTDIEYLRGQRVGADNTESVGELLAAFFHEYHTVFNYAEWVVSARTGKYLLKADKNWHVESEVLVEGKGDEPPRRERHYFCIEDPFETDLDLGRSVDEETLKYLRMEFQRAHNIVFAPRIDCEQLFANYQPSDFPELNLS